MNKLTLSAAALTAALALGATAQPQPAAGKRTGTIDDLRSCMDTRSAFDARQASFNERFAAVAKAGDALGALRKEIEDERQRVEEDPSATGSGRRARFERRERAYREQVEAQRAAQQQVTADREKIQQDFAAFREKCADLAFMQDDIEKVKKEREAAGKK